MTPAEFDYIKRAITALEQPMSLPQRIKVERTMSQILGRSADKLEQNLVDKVEDRLYNTNIQTQGAMNA